jgi:membrane protein YqaA with SNARE-associated domain
MSKQLAALLAISSIWNWVHRFGGPGMILLGLADNSVVPLPGSMDVAVVILTAARPAWWPYYGLMATLGAVLGGYVTYRLAEKGGEETLEKKLGKQRLEKVYKRFEKRGFVTVFIGAILPPPFPIVPFLSTAGVLNYPPKKFLAALASGRGIRFFAVAYVAHIYGKAILGFFSHYYRPLLYVAIGLGVAGGIAVLILFLRKRKEKGTGTKSLEHKAA